MKKAFETFVKGAVGSVPRIGRIYIGKGASGIETATIAGQVKWEPPGDYNISEVIVGGAGIWDKMLAGNPEWRVGQPKNLLTDTSGHSETLEERGLVADYVSKLNRDLTKLDIAKEFNLVSEVQMRGHNDFLITLATGGQVAANEVVICSDPGPSRQLAPNIPVINKPEIQRRPFTELVSGVSFLFNDRPGQDEHIAVIGDGATGAWVIEKCLNSGIKPEQIVWLGQDPKTAFTRASPLGVNAKIMRQTDDVRIVGDIEGIEYLDVKNLSDPSLPGMELTVKLHPDVNPSQPRRGSANFYVSRIVVATGPDELGLGSALSMLSPDVQKTLHPIFDQMGHFGDQSSDEYAVALKSSAGGLYIAGSPTPGALRAILHSSEAYAVANTLPKSAETNVGIPATRAGIRAAVANIAGRLPSDPAIDSINDRLVRDMANKKINFDTGDLHQIAAYLQKFEGIKSDTAYSLAKEIHNQRKQTVGGLKFSQLVKIVGEKIATRAVETHVEVTNKEREREKSPTRRR